MGNIICMQNPLSQIYIKHLFFSLKYSLGKDSKQLSTTEATKGATLVEPSALVFHVFQIFLLCFQLVLQLLPQPLSKGRDIFNMSSKIPKC